MGLIECPKCKKKNTDVIDTCTHCGYNFSKILKNDKLSLRNAILTSLQANLDYGYTYLNSNELDYSDEKNFTATILNKKIVVTSREKNSLNLVNLVTEASVKVKQKANELRIKQSLQTDNTGDDLLEFIDKLSKLLLEFNSDIVKYLIDDVKIPADELEPIINIFTDYLDLYVEKCKQNLNNFMIKHSQNIENYTNKLSAINSNAAKQGAANIGAAMGGSSLIGAIGMFAAKGELEAKSDQAKNDFNQKTNLNVNITTTQFIASFSQLIDEYLKVFYETAFKKFSMFDEGVLDSTSDFFDKVYDTKNILNVFGKLNNEEKEDIKKMIEYIGKDNYLTELYELTDEEIIKYYEKYNNDSYESPNLELLMMLTDKRADDYKKIVLDKYILKKYENNIYTLKGQKKYISFKQECRNCRKEIENNLYLKNSNKEMLIEKINNLENEKITKHRNKLLIIFGSITLIIMIAICIIIGAVNKKNSINITGKTFRDGNNYIKFLDEYIILGTERDDGHYELEKIDCSITYDSNEDGHGYRHYVCGDKLEFYTSIFANSKSLDIDFEDGQRGLLSSGDYTFTSIDLDKVSNIEKQMELCADKGRYCDYKIDKNKITGYYINDTGILFKIERDGEYNLLYEVISTAQLRKLIKEDFEFKVSRAEYYSNKLSNTGNNYTLELSWRAPYKINFTIEDTVINIKKEDNRDLDSKFIGKYYKYKDL